MTTRQVPPSWNESERLRSGATAATESRADRFLAVFEIVVKGESEFFEIYVLVRCVPARKSESLRQRFQYETAKWRLKVIARGCGVFGKGHFRTFLR